jgi:hypothetical protein
MKYNNAGSKLKLADTIPLGIALFTTFITVFFLEKMVLRETGGTFMYPLDDPFIHMQVAKNLAFHSTWGINVHEFGSASSSVLYTLLLAGIFKIFSVNVLVPFIINCIAAVFLLAAVHTWLQKQQINAAGRTVILLGLIFFTPLPVMIISGMEHTLQCLFSFLFIVKFSEWLEDDVRATNQSKNRKLSLPVIIYGILVVMVRYEGLFLISVAGLILLYYRKIWATLQLGALAFLPVIIFGVYSLSQGSYFLPNSVLVKSESLQFSLKGIIEFLNNTLINKLTIVKAPDTPVPGTPPPGITLLATQRLLIALPVTYLLFTGYIKQKSAFFYMFVMLVLGTLLHLAFAGTGWFYRYEAYLIMCSAVVLSTVIYKYGKALIREKFKYAGVLIAVLLFALFFPLILRSTAAYTKAKQACVNIYQQQYQTASFIKKHYNGAVIAANDIGAISYYADIKVVDLWGLGSIDVAKSKKGKYWTPSFLDSLVRKEEVKMAAVYDEWFDPAVLQRWTKVATWKIQNNVICGGDVVSFYVINSADSTELKNKLLDYQKSLPADNKVVYYSKP